MDETALAIARLQEEAKAGKSAESRKGEPGSTGTHSTNRQIPTAVNGMGHRKIGGAAPYTSSKRPKTGGV